MKDLGALLEERFGLSPRAIHLLEGYEDKTYRIDSPKGRNVLKTHTAKPGVIHHLTLENEFVQALDESLPYDFPLPLKTTDGSKWEPYGQKLIRLLPFLEGDFLAEVTHTDKLLESLGTFLGKVNQVGMSLTPETVLTGAPAWDLQHLPFHKQNLNALEDPKDRALIEYYLLQYDQIVEPWRYSLRKCLIHNDANDWNVLTQKGTVSGIIDFGDMCYSWLINELAVALPYVLAEREDPLRVAGIVIKAYHREFPLKREELELLYYLIAGRICMSLCNSARAAKLRPESDYIRISELSMKQLLHKWISISPEAAANCFLEAAGLETLEFNEADDYISRRNEVIPRSLSLSYSHPIVMKRAAFQYMFNNRGNRFLDAYNNIMLVGHCHPGVVEATTRTLHRINTNTRYLYSEILNYSEHLLSYFPPKLNRVFLVNSGSAATDLALRLSRAYTGRDKILALKNGYHGNTLAGIAVSHYKHKKGISYPDTLLCPMPKAFGSGLPDDGSAGSYFTKFAKELLAENPGQVGAFIAEPVMGCGGQVPLARGFLPEVYNDVRLQGGICISDEVQVGFGRLGSWNWGYEKHGVIPDMVILGKPMGNGHPIGAVVTTAEIGGAFDSGPEFFSSFGGNPVSCAAGEAVLRVLEEEGLKAHALDTGTYLKAAFHELSTRHKALADIRGDGLFLGVELLDPLGKPNTALAQKLKNELRDSYILIGTDGPCNNVLKIKPPLPFNQANCDELIGQMGRILENLPDS